MKEILLYAEIAQAILMSCAIVFGGAWAYFNFISGRVLKPKLESSIEMFHQKNKCSATRLHVKVTLKNVGLTKVNIDQKATGLRIFKIIDKVRLSGKANELFEAEWDRLGTFSIFDQHQWIEPSEIISECKILDLYTTSPCFKAESTIMTKKQSWFAVCISSKK